MALCKILETFLVVFLCSLVTNINCEACNSLYPPYNRGLCLNVDECPGGTYQEICSGGREICCVTEASITEPVNPVITKTEFLRIVGDTTRNRNLFAFFDKSLKDAAITTKHQVAAFLAQIMYESGNLEWLEENNDGETYENKPEYGNNEDGDGRRFIRRGLFRTIGRFMYNWIGGEIGEDLVGFPEKLALPSVAFKAASWLWSSAYQEFNNGKLETVNLNKFCNGSKYHFVLLTLAVRGNTEGLETRLQYWKKAMKILNTSCPKEGRGKACIGQDGSEGNCRLKTSCKAAYETTNKCPASDLIACCLDTECDAPIDLAFLMDASGSIGNSDFVKARQFVYDVCDRFDITEDRTKVALIRYSASAKVLFNFNKYSKKEDLLSAIQTIEYTKGGTRTDKALKLAHEELFGSSSDEIRELNKGASRVVIVMTDGKTNLGIGSIVQPSYILRKNDSVNIFVLGIGKQSVDKDELNEIASDPDAAHVFLLSSFNEMLLGSFIDTIKESACYEPAVVETSATVSSTVGKNDKRYFKVETEGLAQTVTVEVEATEGEVDLFSSTTEANPGPTLPGDFTCDWGSGSSSRARRSTALCAGSGNQTGVIGEVITRRSTKYMYVTPCSQDWLYLGIHGVKDRNVFRFVIHNDTIPIPDLNEPFPLEVITYIGCCLALIVALITLLLLIIFVCTKYRPELNGDVKGKAPSQTRPATTSGVDVSVTDGKSWVVFIPCCTDVSDKTSLETTRGLRSMSFASDIQISQVLCLVVAEITFLAGINATNSQGGCTFTTLVLSYTFLVMFLWLLVEGFSLVFHNIKKIPIPVFYVFSWGLPLLPVAILASKHQDYSGYHHCWLSFQESIHWAFTTFLMVFILAQAVQVGIFAIKYFKQKAKQIDSDNANDLRNGVFSVCSISGTAVLTATLGISAVSNRQIVYQYMFALSNIALSILMFGWYVYIGRKEVFSVLKSLNCKCCKCFGSKSYPLGDGEAAQSTNGSKKDEDKAKKGTVQSTKPKGTPKPSNGKADSKSKSKAKNPPEKTGAKAANEKKKKSDVPENKTAKNTKQTPAKPKASSSQPQSKARKQELKPKTKTKGGTGGNTSSSKPSSSGQKGKSTEPSRPPNKLPPLQITNRGQLTPLEAKRGSQIGI